MGSSATNWVGSLLSGPASNLLSGLIGAIVGVAGLFLIQGLQTRALRREAQAAARLIYIEIGYNIEALQGLDATTVSLPLIVGSAEWERHSEKLATVMPEQGIAKVAAPYVQLSVYRVVFAQPWYYMAASRLRGTDVEALKKISDGFREAEAALRPLVWTGPRLAGLTKVMTVTGDPFAPRSIGRRIRVAMSDIPMEFLALLAVGLFTIRGFLWVMDTVKKWFGPERK